MPTNILPITITPKPVSCPTNPDAEYYLRLIAPQYDSISNREGFLCLSYTNTPQGAKYEYRVALRAANYMWIFLNNSSSGGGGGGSVINVDPTSVKSYKEGDITITYRDNIVIPAGASGQATNPYERELLDLEADILGTAIGVHIIL